MALIASLFELLWPAPRRNTLTTSREVKERNRAQWAKLGNAGLNPSVEVRVSKILKETQDTITLELSTQDQHSITWQAGQFLTCCFDRDNVLQHDPQLQLENKELRRAYSISAAPSTGLCRITVKRLKDGIVSGYIHEHLDIGDSFKVLGPSGDFTLPNTSNNVEHYLFIAAGSGITPIYSQICELLESHTDTPVTLLYGNRRAKDIIFRKALDQLAAQHPHFTVHYALSRPAKSWKGLKGRIDTTLLDQVIESCKLDSNTLRHRSHIAICGPAALMDSLHGHLLNLGVSEQQIQTEAFTPAPKAVIQHPQDEQKIYFKRSQRWVVAKPGESILEAGLRSGIDLQYSCQVGGCGHCKVSVAKGDVISDEPNCLSDSELAQGQRLACLSYACSETEVEA